MNSHISILQTCCILLFSTSMTFDRKGKSNDINATRQNRYNQSSTEKRNSDTKEIAIAWKEAIGSLPNYKIGRRISVDPRFTYRFIGFFEGRMGLKTPRWWDKSITESEAFCNWNVTFPTHHFPSYRYRKFGINHPYNISVEKNNNGYSVTKNSNDIMLENKKMSELQRNNISDRINVCFTKSTVYVILFSDQASSYYITSIDRSSNIVNWKSLVEGSGINAYMGLGSHHAEIVVKKEKVCVFGLEGISAYVEAFHQTTGKRMFRFTTHDPSLYPRQKKRK